MRMRTIEQAFQHIHDHDPQTALTKTALRRMVKSGQVPSVKVGQKFLIDLDAVQELLQSGTPQPSPAPAPTTGTIRRVEL